MNNKEKGRIYEDIACKYLSKKGYSIIERNFYYYGGEIDIIANKDGKLIFIEVKYRGDSRFGTSDESIDNFKINRIVKGIKYYLYINKIFNKDIKLETILIDKDILRHENIDI